MKILSVKNKYQNKHINKQNPPFMIKTLNKLVIEGNFLNMIKVIYKNSTANIIFNEETLNFPLKSRTGQECLPLPILFNIVLNILAKATGQENETEGIHIGKKEVKLVKLSLYADDMILYIEKS